MRDVAFDDVAVVAIHRAHEIGKGGLHAGRQGAVESGALLREVQGEVGQPA
jgi:hypothetical protein